MKDQLGAALKQTNAAAFLRVIRNGETDAGDDQAYRWLYGSTRKVPKLFDSFERHPNVRTYERYDGEFIANGKIDFTTAAGAYQETFSTWNDFCRAMAEQLPFTPENQDLCAVWLIDRAHALDDVLAGRLDAAIAKLGAVWTSLKLKSRRAEAPEIFNAYGGRLADDAAAPLTTEVKPMTPLVLPLLETLVPMIPQLGKLFGSGSEVSNRNIAAAQVIADNVVKATQAVNLQDAVERVQSDPSALEAAKQAVSDSLFTIGEAGGGGIDGARNANRAAGDSPLGHDRAFIIACMFWPLIALVVIASLLNLSWLAPITPETRSMVIGFVMGTVAGGILAYFFGTTKQSERKTELLASGR